MKWPWVSRLAYDVVSEERTALRARVAVLEDQIVRMKRVELGMREVPKSAAPGAMQRPIVPPPEVIRLYHGRFQSKAMEDAYAQQAVDMHRAGAPWPEVARALVDILGEPPEVQA